MLSAVPIRGLPFPDLAESHLTPKARFQGTARAASLSLAIRNNQSRQREVMGSDYEAICDENRRRYGTDIARIGPMLLVDRYDDRAHFIFELLQNAEDALGRRGNSQGPRQVTFHLSPTVLLVSHYGKPFDQADVRGVCGIAESTKDKFAIGRFGIGFKSVYMFTDHPEIHSGDEDFSVENYVLPQRIDRNPRAVDETQIILPLRANDPTAAREIAAGLRHLGPDALLFLRHVDEINWQDHDGSSGTYLRSKPEQLGGNVRRVAVVGHESGKPEVDQNWLVFSRDVFSPTQEMVGQVEIAFSLSAIKDAPGHWRLQPVATSLLVVFFPTIRTTNLGFLVQGPYRTTPSRDNVPGSDPWNQHLVKETAGLLAEAMQWLRDNAMLDSSALRCFPLNRDKFPKDNMFTPIFDAVRQSFFDEALLPGFGGGFISAGQAKLGRTQELRELLSTEQIATLLGTGPSAWLAGDITAERTPEIRHYLLHELDITELTPASLASRLKREFLEAQPDAWIARLYEFMGRQEAAFRRYLDTIPLIRLDNGSHVTTHDKGHVCAFLPGPIETSFPTVRRAVCDSTESRRFLSSLGITEPDPVDDVVLNLLPKYQQRPIRISDKDYPADIERILSAFDTDSKIQREKLLTALRETTFVRAVDAGSKKIYFAAPGAAYLATDRIKALFAGIPDVLIVDDATECLRGERVRELLETIGVVRYPRPLAVHNTLTEAERLALREKTGYASTSGQSDRVTDWELRGFFALMGVLSRLEPDQQTERARLIWESLGDLEERRGRAVFDGSYTWSHYGERKTPPFPAAFLRRLNKVAWIPDANGELVPPNLVLFDSLAWKPNPFLQSKILFKPPILDQLAKEAGIDPATIDLLRKLGITSVADLTSRLNLASPASVDEAEDVAASNTSVDIDAPDSHSDHDPANPPGTRNPEGAHGRATHATQANHGHGGHHFSHQASGTSSSVGGVNNPGGRREGTGSQPHHTEGRSFISYISVHTDDDPQNPDDLSHAARMQTEEHGIAFITSIESTLQRTPPGTPGFDLYEVDAHGSPCRWVEVKALTGTLDDHPVGISHVQFDYAREKGNAYWLYIVEHANEPTEIRVLRIQNPVAHTRTFAFDKGWRHIAHVEPPTLSLSPIER